MKKRVILMGFMALWLSPVMAAAQTNSDAQAQQKDSADQEKSQRIRRALTLRPFIFKRLNLIRELVDEKSYDRALEVVGQLEKQKRNRYERAMTHNMAAYVHLSQEQYTKAIAAYRQLLAIKRIPNSLVKNTRYSLVKLLAVEGQYDEALRELDDWLNATGDKKNADAYFLRAQLLYQLKRYKEANTPMQAALAVVREKKEHGKEPWLLLERAIHFQTKDYAALARCLEVLSTHYPKSNYWVQLAATYSELGQPLKELATLEVAYEQRLLSNENEVMQLAQALLGSDVPYKAADVIDTALQNKTIEPSVSILALLGDAWILSKEYAKAIPVMLRAAQLSGKGADFFKVAQIQSERQQWDQALINVEQALSIGDFKQVPSAWVLKGLILFNQNNLQQALVSFEQAKTYPQTAKLAQKWLLFVDGETKRQAYLSTL